MPLDFATLQSQVGSWSRRNFPNNERTDPFLGVVEETGELAKAIDESIFDESFIQIPDYEGWYSASDHGNIRRDAGGKGAHPGENRTLNLREDGYVDVAISRGSKDDLKVIMVHKLVALAWIGPCPEGFEVNHKDGDKSNNCAWNLEYITPAENQIHAISIGLRVPASGSRHGMSILNETKAQQIRDIHAAGEYTHKQISEMFGVSRSTVSLIVKGQIWVDKPRVNYDQLRPFLKVQDQVGLISHAILKRQQGIRGTASEHIAAEKDAVADIIIYLADFCERSGYNLQDIVETTWKRVGARDWTANKANGGDVAP